jgi:hypothetical protein
MSKLRFPHEFIAPFTEAFGFPPEPPPCFYLEDPLLEEPCQISTLDLGNVCVLNGITFHVDDDLGCQMFNRESNPIDSSRSSNSRSNHAEQERRTCRQ